MQFLRLVQPSIMGTMGDFSGLIIAVPLNVTLNLKTDPPIQPTSQLIKYILQGVFELPPKLKVPLVPLQQHRFSRQSCAHNAYFLE